MKGKLTAGVLARARRGTRSVHFPTDNARLGNLLYDWTRAHARQQLGHDHRVLITEATRQWLPFVPQIHEEILIERDAVKFSDRRTVGYHQCFGIDFTGTQIKQFVLEQLLPSPLLRARQHELAPFGTVHVISDDLEWCARALVGPVSEVGAKLSMPGPERTPASDLQALAGARRLVLANSTFSYWGGYISSVIHDNHPLVVAPYFHARGFADGLSIELDPRWTVVDLPAAWSDPGPEELG